MIFYKNKIIYAETLKDFLEQLEIEDVNICLCNPPNSIGYLGVEFFLTLANIVKKHAINKKINIAIDCSDKAGFALNAMSQNKNKVDFIIINTNNEIFDKLSSIAKLNNILVVKSYLH